MTKKYRLSTSKYKEFISDYLIEYDGMELTRTGNKNEFVVVPDVEDANMTLVVIPDEFQEFVLNEIKIPVTFEEIMDIIEERPSSLTAYNYEDMKKCHELTIENERLKHEPKQTFEEWDKSANVICETNIELMQRYTGRKEGWHACEKNRGYSED